MNRYGWRKYLSSRPLLRCRSDDRLAARDVGGVVGEWNLVDVEVRVRVVAEIRTRVEPEIEHFAKPGGAEVCAALVHEPGHRDPLLAERGEQAFVETANGREVARSAVAAARQIVDRDRDGVLRGRGARVQRKATESAAGEPLQQSARRTHMDMDSPAHAQSALTTTEEFALEAARLEDAL